MYRLSSRFTKLSDRPQSERRGRGIGPWKKFVLEDVFTVNESGDVNTFIHVMDKSHFNPASARQPSRVPTQPRESQRKGNWVGETRGEERRRRSAGDCVSLWPRKSETKPPVAEFVKSSRSRSSSRPSEVVNESCEREICEWKLWLRLGVGLWVQRSEGIWECRPMQECHSCVQVCGLHCV